MVPLSLSKWSVWAQEVLEAIPLTRWIRVRVHGVSQSHVSGLSEVEKERLSKALFAVEPPNIGQAEENEFRIASGLSPSRAVTLVTERYS